MKLETIAAGLMLGALVSAGGCSYHDGGPGGPDVVQAGYSVDDPYYEQGAYDGDYWVWHDQQGHVHRQARADHERRANVDAQRGRSDAQRRDVGQANRPAQQQAAHGEVRQGGDARQGVASHGPSEARNAGGAAQGHGGDAAAGHGSDEGGDHR